MQPYSDPTLTAQDTKITKKTIYEVVGLLLGL
jgi:hypothetical protein